MSRYTINFTNPDTKLPLLIEEDTIDESTSLKLYGRGKTAYGEALWTNLVNMLENFYGPNEPRNATLGQLWFDSVGKKLKVLSTGSSTKEWIEVGAPPSLSIVNGVLSLAEPIKSNDVNSGIPTGTDGDASQYDYYYMTRGYGDQRYIRRAIGSTNTVPIDVHDILSYKNINNNALTNNSLVTKAYVDSVSSATSGSVSDPNLTSSYASYTNKFGVLTSTGKDTTQTWLKLDDTYVYIDKSTDGKTKVQEVYGNKHFANKLTLSGDINITGNLPQMLNTADILSNTVASQSITDTTELTISTAILLKKPQYNATKNAFDFVNSGTNVKNNIMITNGAATQNIVAGSNTYSINAVPEWKNIKDVLRDDATDETTATTSYIPVFNRKKDVTNQITTVVEWKAFQYDSIFGSIDTLVGEHMLTVNNGIFTWKPTITVDAATITPTIKAVATTGGAVDLTGTVGTNVLGSDILLVEVFVSSSASSPLYSFNYNVTGTTNNITLSGTQWTASITSAIISSAFDSFATYTSGHDYFTKVTRTSSTNATISNSSNSLLSYSIISAPTVLNSPISTNDTTPTITGTIGKTLAAGDTLAVSIKSGTTLVYQFTKTTTVGADITIAAQKWTLNVPIGQELTPGDYNIIVDHTVNGIKQTGTGTITITAPPAQPTTGLYYISL